ncbi:MAG: hypothetical protein AAF411_06190 [Myxococcota bacterium]
MRSTIGLFLALATAGCFQSYTANRPDGRGRCMDGRPFERQCADDERCEVSGPAGTFPCRGTDCQDAERTACAFSDTVRDGSVADQPTGDVAIEDPRGCEGLIRRAPVPNETDADILFVIDNSSSMREEQASLSEEIPGLINALVTGRMGDREFAPVGSVRVGVVSTDMGTGGFGNVCPEPRVGDDGILQRGSGCAAPELPFLDFQPAGDPIRFASQVACRTNVGTEGCGFEQPLEAMLKALTPSTSSIAFRGADGRSVPGHADGPNQGFLRDGSLLVVVLLSDEDDCSAANPLLFNPDNRRIAPELNDPRLNLRCTSVLYGSDPDVLHPLSRYLEGLLALRAPKDIVFSAIVGVPARLSAELAGDEVDYGILLGDSSPDCTEGCRDPLMVERPQDAATGDPSLLVPSCDQTAAGRGVAYPPVRISRFARDLDEAGATSVVQSICQENFGPPLSLVIERIRDPSVPICFGEPLERGPSGGIACSVREELPAEAATRCADLIGRVPTGERTEDGGEICFVCQGLSASDDSIDEDPACVALNQAAWWYDDAQAFETCPRGEEFRIVFRADAPPVPGGEIVVECDAPRTCR